MMLDLYNVHLRSTQATPHIQKTNECLTVTQPFQIPPHPITNCTRYS